MYKIQALSEAPRLERVGANSAAMFRRPDGTSHLIPVVLARCLFSLAALCSSMIYEVKTRY